jgi:sugar phosphate isomerase/epimerase
MREIAFISSARSISWNKIRGDGELKFIRINNELWDMSKYPPGLALHTLRNELHQDFIGTLRKVASIGYKLIEPTNYGGLTADEFVKVLKCLGLGVVSTRILPNLDELAFQLDYAKKIGAKYFYTIFVDKENFKDEASIQEVIRKLKIMGMEAKRRGIQLCITPAIMNME